MYESNVSNYAYLYIAISAGAQPKSPYTQCSSVILGENIIYSLCI